MGEVSIVAFDDQRHHEAFKALNERWIREIFKHIEATDIYELEHPVEHIIAAGGYIFIAELGGKPVGSFAMMKSSSPLYDFELVKFAVDPSAQGHHIGSRLIQCCLAKAREVGGRRLFIETNHRCAEAVHLYEKYGFHQIPVGDSNYARCDIQMVQTL